jgi:hypothetical protein
MSIQDEVAKLLCDIDLSRSSPPFLEKTFTSIRKQLAPHIDDPDFRSWFDTAVLPHFLRKVEMAYFDLVYDAKLSPESIGLDADFIESLKRKDEFARLSRLLAKWNVEIEVSVDIIERACLYNLYMKPSVIVDLNEEIRSNWAMKDASLLKRGVIRVLNFAASSTASMSSAVSEQAFSRAAFNFANLKTAAATSLLYVFMGTALPVALLTVIGTQASLLVGGWVAAKTGEGIHNTLDSYALHTRLQGLQSQLEAMLKQLTALNKQCADSITSCSQSNSVRDKLALSKLLSQLLVQKPQLSDLRASWAEEQSMMDCLQVTEIDDYLLVDLVEPDIDGFMAI